MAYWVHDRDSEPTSGLECVDRDSALAALAAMPDGQKITYIPSETEWYNFRDRERQRFRSGQYLRVPWADYEDSDSCRFAHLSVKTPGLVAFTKTPEHGINDRQTAIAPGRYLDTFFKGQFTDEARRAYIAACKAENLELKIARTPEAIVNVYMTGRITSCMDRNHFREASDNPTCAYGNSDLAVAWFGETDNARARCVVWPDKKRYSRLYGDVDTLTTLLQADGYTHGSMQGAKIRAIESRYGGYMMPYVDGIDNGSLSPRGTHIILDGDGPLNCQVTCGYAEEENRMHTCEHCGSEYEYDDDDDSGYCSDCENHRSSCYHCDNTVWTDGDDWVSNDNGVLCDDCAQELRNDCAIDSCDETWFDCDLSREQKAERARLHLTAVCRDCQRLYSYCETCDDYFDVECLDCPECHIAPDIHCDKTADLLTPADGIPLDTPCVAVPGNGTDTLADAVRGSTWVRLIAPSVCNIASCQAVLGVGTIALRMRDERTGRTSNHYCRHCVTTTRDRHDMGFGLAPALPDERLSA